MRARHTIPGLAVEFQYAFLNRKAGIGKVCVFKKGETLLTNFVNLCRKRVVLVLQIGRLLLALALGGVLRNLRVDGLKVCNLRFQLRRVLKCHVFGFRLFDVLFQTLNGVGDFL